MYVLYASVYARRFSETIDLHVASLSTLLFPGQFGLSPTGIFCYPLFQADAASKFVLNGFDILSNSSFKKVLKQMKEGQVSGPIFQGATT